MYAMNKKQKKVWRQEQDAWGKQKKRPNGTQSQAGAQAIPGGHASQSSNKKQKPNPNSNQQKNQGQQSQPNQPKKPAHVGQNTQHARAASQGPSTPGAKKARASGSASPSPAPVSAPTMPIPTPIRNQPPQSQNVSSPSMQGFKGRYVEANVEIQDESGKVIDLGRPGEPSFPCNTQVLQRMLMGKVDFGVSRRDRRQARSVGNDDPEINLAACDHADQDGAYQTRESVGAYIRWSVSLSFPVLSGLP